MNIRDLRYLTAVCDELHFGRAATRCHISQPALSGQIRKLEDFLGVTLFERTNRTVQVTPIGRRIIDQARHLLKISDDIIATAQSAQSPFSGTFRLGMISTIGPYLAPVVLATIREHLPDLSVILVESLTTDLEARLVAGDLDGAILATSPLESQLTAVSLYEEPFWVALANHHPLAAKSSLFLDELSHDELLLLADGHCLRDQVLDVCHRTTDSTHTNTLETSIETLLSLVAAGEGITLAPALTLYDNRNRKGLTVRPEASGTAGRRIRLVHRKTFPRPEVITRLAALVRETVPGSQVTPIDTSE